MDATTITIIVAIGGFILAALTYIAGTKKTGEERARFEGMVEEKLDRLQVSLDKLEERLSKNTTELYDEIDKKIHEHEEHYHHE